ncbi:hypothetical protein AMTR_s00006p00263750 [Amborella trichopoda]|uniref:Uncharacterized protein n=1 Tax=Amborella trichopoda TaxID=13333 RepID=W1PE02_AMBTC|nr:hypothetical protein AMTR_s00006p00263750 [Amborella trichopoda]
MEAENACPPEIEDEAHLIVKKCGGLPLAIVAIGAMMSKKDRNPRVWEQVHRSLEWELNNRSNFELVRGELVRGVLLLSYKDLPPLQRHCFLYCCLFPEDYNISRSQLVRQWIAEGFIEGRPGMTEEEVAEEYFKDLLDRNLILVGRTGKSGQVRECRVHDVVRALGVSLLEREKFGVFHDGQNQKLETTTRRVSMSSYKPMDLSRLRTFLMLNIDREIGRNSDAGSVIPGSLCSSRFISCLRTIFKFFTRRDIQTETETGPVMPGLLCGSRFLRVLDLQGMELKRVPEEVGQLILLRYLALGRWGSDELVEVTEAVANLTRLQTLHLNCNKNLILPIGISNMEALTCLKIFTGCIIGVRGLKAPERIGGLTNLQILKGVAADSMFIRYLANLTQLRSQTIELLSEEDGETLCASIQEMKSMHSLCIYFEGGLWVRELVSLPQMRSLQKLRLFGRLETQPSWFNSSLTVIELGCSNLTEDPFDIFQTLPNLMHLNLVQAYLGSQLGECRAQGFPKLQILFLIDLPNLENWGEVEQGGMPVLRMVSISECKNLKALPEGFQHLISLQFLTLESVSDEFVIRLRNEDHYKVQHIPFAEHMYRDSVDGQWKSEHL